ncbi:hypothetical protein T12_2081 [Trichinella patagoniensis]|uniref:Uncharacterized protein n=1 Tax=Trichinella patagoniensis TaxID=990121 RepID=A0A0V0Z4A0_9BILA|nr:hypothetical protein T12_2081 [Trichinella patagoniensis]
MSTGTDSQKTFGGVLYACDAEVQFTRRSFVRQMRVDCMMWILLVQTNVGSQEDGPVELFRQKTKRRKAKATVRRIGHEDQRQITVVVVYVRTWQLASCQEMRFGKRETERKGNAPVNTSSSPNSDGRTNNLFALILIALYNVII